MGIEWYNINSYLSIGVDWNSTTSASSVVLAPKVYRWDQHTANNSGGRFAETLTPDPNGTGSWSNIGFGSGTGTREIDSFSSRTYNKGHSSSSVTLEISWTQIGTWYSGSYHTLGSGSHTWTYTVPAKESYGVTYNANGGSGAPGSQTKWYGETLTLSSTKPTRTGHAFKNWNTASGGGGTAYSSGGSYTSNATLALYAQWTANTYTISYNANGGSGAPGSQTKTYGKNLTLSSTKPTRTNYNFLGWSTSKTATSAQYASGATFTTNATTTLYAVWELAYWKPKISLLKADRCNSSGTLDDFQTYAKVTFKWECCQITGTNNIKTITIQHKAESATSWTSTSVTASGTSGTVSKIISGLSIDSRYDVQAVVTDSKSGSSTLATKLGGSEFPIDILNGGTGVAFGQPAKNADAVETPWFIRTTYSDCGFRHTHPNGKSISIGVGSGGTNRGIWDSTVNKWIFHSDTNNYVYVNGKRVMHGTYANGYWGLTNPDGSTSGWTRTTSSGIIPYASGGASSSLGTSTWPFNNIYGKNLYWGTRKLTDNKVLWTGAIYPNANHTITLPEGVSKQPHGIVLAFCGYENGAPTNTEWTYFFVAKYHMQDHSHNGLSFNVSGHWVNGMKYLYITDTTIEGNDLNSQTKTVGGVTYINSYYVLRHVIGV